MPSARQIVVISTVSILAVGLVMWVNRMSNGAFTKLPLVGNVIPR